MLRSLLDIAITPAIRAVTFDVGGTLIRPWPSVGHVYAEVAAQHGLAGLDPDQLTRAFREAWRARERFNHTREEWAALVDATFLQLAPAARSQTFFDVLYERFTEASAWRVFDDVEPALARLKRAGVRLGVISNWDERLRPLLRNLRLHEHFSSITVSCEAGEPKPGRQIFRHAAAALDLPPESILHVGDEPSADVAGAQAAGYQAALIQRG